MTFRLVTQSINQLRHRLLQTIQVVSLNMTMNRTVNNYRMILFLVTSDTETTTFYSLSGMVVTKIAAMN